MHSKCIMNVQKSVCVCVLPFTKQHPERERGREGEDGRKRSMPWSPVMAGQEREEGEGMVGGGSKGGATNHLAAAPTSSEQASKGERGWDGCSLGTETRAVDRSSLPPYFARPHTHALTPFSLSLSGTFWSVHFSFLPSFVFLLSLSLLLWCVATFSSFFARHCAMAIKADR